MNNITIQDLLDVEAQIPGENKELLEYVRNLIRKCRDEQHRPVCFGLDDCSTRALSVCTWRIDCGYPYEEKQNEL